MVLNVNPGDMVRVTFDLTNTGSPVSGLADDEFDMSVIFAKSDIFTGSVFSGAMITNQSKNFSVDIAVPTDITPETYNLEIEVWYKTQFIGYAIVSDAVDITGVYSVSISNISITKV